MEKDMAIRDKIDHYSLLCLSSVTGLGPYKVRILVERFGSPQRVLQSSPRELVQIPGIDKIMAERIRKEADHKFAKDQLQRLEKSRIKVVSFWDNDYPAGLKTLFDPPVLLFVHGELNPDTDQSIAIVGTRQATNYGRWVTEKFTRELVSHNYWITSGLARGIDTIAHRQCLNCGGKTVAVLGSGLDRIYPAENTELSRHISNQGAVVSEFPMGAGPDAPHFPRRNRIISALSRAVLVIEAGEKSGALITTDFALEQGKDVFVVPGNINSPASQGTNKLIQEGAKLVLKVEDILDEIAPSCNGQQSLDLSESVNVSPKEKQLLSQMTSEPIHIDQLAELIKMEPFQIFPLLLSLELKHFVKQIPGKYFVRL
ncbi:DNA-protecting protein DprA [candidate division KSB1 bacterium]|jgi:DNA processing protein|nr:DNA-protecting protein DprA [candidate division KSB1 bacterium]